MPAEGRWAPDDGRAPPSGDDEGQGCGAEPQEPPPEPGSDGNLDFPPAANTTNAQAHVPAGSPEGGQFAGGGGTGGAGGEGVEARCEAHRRTSPEADPTGPSGPGTPRTSTHDPSWNNEDLGRKQLVQERTSVAKGPDSLSGEGGRSAPLPGETMRGGRQPQPRRREGRHDPRWVVARRRETYQAQYPGKRRNPRTGGVTRRAVHQGRRRGRLLPTTSAPRRPRPRLEEAPIPLPRRSTRRTHGEASTWDKAKGANARPGQGCGRLARRLTMVRKNSPTPGLGRQIVNLEVAGSNPVGPAIFPCVC